MGIIRKAIVSERKCTHSMLVTELCDVLYAATTN